MDTLTLDEYRALVAAEASQAARGARKPKSAPRMPRAPQEPAQGPGSSFQGRLDKAARNGWHAIESPDALRYRWRQNGGRVGPWGTYEEATKYGATHRPEDT
jgi:hypothetical protein